MEFMEKSTQQNQVLKGEQKFVSLQQRQSYLLPFMIIVEQEKQSMNQQSEQNINLSQNEEPKLLIKIVKGLPNATPQDSLKEGTILQITPTILKIGDQPAQELKQPKLVRCGRIGESKALEEQNDFCFPGKFKSVSRNQFHISYTNSFSLICLSKSNPTSIRVQKTPIELIPDMVIQLPNNNIFRVKSIQRSQIDGVPIHQQIPGTPNPAIMTLKFDILSQNNEKHIEDQFSKLGSDSSSSNDTGTIVFADDSEETYQQQLKKPNQKLKEITQSQIQEIEFLFLEGFKKNERYVFKSNQQSTITIGRNKLNNICITDQLVSDFHCQIMFLQNKWVVGEQQIIEQTKPSSSGTLIYLKSAKELGEKIPSLPLQLQKGLKFQVEEIIFEVL